MTMKTRLLAAGIVTAVAVAAGGTAYAASSNPITVTKGMDVRMPLAGASQRTSIVIDANTGGLTSVTIDPSSGFVATKAEAHRVTFRNSSLPVKLEVKVDGNTLSNKLTARSLTTIVGSGSFSSDLFGTGAVVVPYAVGMDAAGRPTLSLGTPTVPGGVTVASTGTTLRPRSAGARAGFTANGMTKWLLIGLSAGRGGANAELVVAVQAEARQVLPLAALAGSKTWTGPTCGGVTNSLTYVVNPDGTFGAATATPTARLRTSPTKIRADYRNWSRVELRLRVANGIGVLSIDEKPSICRNLPAPTVNAVLGTNGSGHNGKQEHDDEGHDRHDDRGRGRGDD
jgi:hypothetical protein